tara:strand:+ start:610 stop:882 length:273 start_codon:yes stop_codon:yes gene_type:complete
MSEMKEEMDIVDLTFIDLFDDIDFERDIVEELENLMKIAIKRACERYGLDREADDIGWVIGFTHPDVLETGTAIRRPDYSLLPGIRRESQ